jgi:hypothetical protein
MTNPTTPDSPPARQRAWSRLFFWTGIATMLPGLQFVLPAQVLRWLGADVGGSAGLLYAQHWALLLLCFGALLVHASRSGAARGAVVLAAAVEKAGFAMLVAMSWNDPALQRLHGAAVFDSGCVVLYAIWLWREASPAVAKPA